METTHNCFGLSFLDLSSNLRPYSLGKLIEWKLNHVGVSPADGHQIKIVRFLLAREIN
jgi:hypothetical protein